MPGLSVVAAPERIVGFQHAKHLHPAHRDRGCYCGCAWSEGCEGTLRHDEDTPKLIELGMAIYDFPANEFHGERAVCYSLDEMAGNVLEGGGC